MRPSSSSLSPGLGTATMRWFCSSSSSRARAALGLKKLSKAPAIAFIPPAEPPMLPRSHLSILDLLRLSLPSTTRADLRWFTAARAGLVDADQLLAGGVHRG